MNSMMKIPPLINKFCDAVWEYDADTNQVYLYYDDMTPELCNQWLCYDTINEIYQKNYISSLDLGIWQYFLTPEGLRRFLNGAKEEEHFYIRFEHTQKGSEWHEVYFQQLEENRLLLASRDVKEMQRNAAIAKAVVPEFDYVCCIDVATQSYVLYYSDANNTVVPQSVSDNYHKILEDFNRTYVIPEEADILTAHMRLDYVLKQLEEEEEYILYATVREEGSLTYKKIRFSYESAVKDKILLTRTDVGELIGQKKLLEKEREKRLQYLENMPVAFCSTKVFLDEKGKPYDFQFTYCNRAHEELEGVQEGELTGKNFYEFFNETDPTWLQYYYETAYQGISHIIRRYSPEIAKHLLIYTFQSEPGNCECVLLDVSEEYFLTQELESSREDMRRILETTTALVFQYIPERTEVILNENGKKERQVLTKEELQQMLLEKDMLDHDYWTILEKGFSKIESGEHSVSMILRCKLSPDEKRNWYKIVMFDFQDGYTHERRVFGFFQNIDQDKSREEELKRRAQIDSLTGVFNSGTGKQEVSNKLEKLEEQKDCYYALFVMDIDNFKSINDTRGHLTGDQVLTEFAKTLRKAFRTEDIIYRLGGDEFVVFVEKIHELDQSIGVMMHRFHIHMEKTREKYPFLACSVGIFVSEHRHTFEECYKMADLALYETKNNHKGYYTVKKDSAAWPEEAPV